MQKKYILSLSFFSFLLIASLLLLKTPSNIPVEKEKATCCKKTAIKCLENSKEESIPATNLENLSHQFIATPILLY